MSRSSPIRRRGLMCVGPLALAVADGAITLWGQAPEYWSQGYQLVREHNPLAHLLLRWHPLAFVIAMLVWLFLIVLVIRWLPVSLARVAAFAIMMAHAVGVTVWLLNYRYGLVAAIPLLLVVKVFDSLIWKRDGRESDPE